MYKMNFTLLLSLLLLNLTLIFCVDVNTATQDYILTNVDIEDRSPKNILVTSYVGGRSHLKPMLDIAAILIERGHNVSIKKLQACFLYFISKLDLYLTIFTFDA